MIGKRQFSLRFLLAETFVIGCALAIFRVAFIVHGGPGQLLVGVGLVFVGAAVGGWFGSMAEGAKLALLTLLVSGILGFLFLAGNVGPGVVASVIVELVARILIVVGPVVLLAYLAARFAGLITGRP